MKVQISVGVSYICMIYITLLLILVQEIHIYEHTHTHICIISLAMNNKDSILIGLVVHEDGMGENVMKLRIDIVWVRRKCVPLKKKLFFYLISLDCI